MKLRTPVKLESPADQQSLENAEKAATLLHSWFRDLTPVSIETRGTSPTQRLGRGVGCFFSGGVDSFYSVLARRDEITHLVFVHGFDIPLEDNALAERAIQSLTDAAAALSLPLITVRTDLRGLAERVNLDWGRHYHGAALSAVAQLLSPHLDRMIFPSSYYRDDLHPWGSHPDLDPLWSSAKVIVEHHGEDTTRPQKVEFLAKHQVALDHLRVCYRNDGGAYNCGKCEKCIRTMINLRISGALEKCRTLPTQLPTSQLRSLRFDHGARLFAAENLRELRRRRISDPELEEALQQAMRPDRKAEVRRAVKHSIVGFVRRHRRMHTLAQAVRTKLRRLG